MPSSCRIAAAVILIGAAFTYAFGLCLAETYTATAHLAPLVKAERDLFASLKAYIDDTVAFLTRLRAFSKRVKEGDTCGGKYRNDSRDFSLCHQTVKLRVVVRLAAEWKNLVHALKQRHVEGREFSFFASVHYLREKER